MDIEYLNPLITHKKPWRRLVSADADIIPPLNAENYDLNDFGAAPAGMQWQLLTEYNLLAEATEGAHIINSKYLSKRPIYEVEERVVDVPQTNEDGSPKLDAQGNQIFSKEKVEDWVITGYEDIETVRSGLPEMINKQKASHLGQNGIEIANECEDEQAYAKLRSWKEISGLDSAWLQAIYADTKGDAAIYQFVHGGSITYSVFGTIFGDQLFPNKDKKGRDMLCRKYMLNGREAVDVFTAEYIATFVRDLSAESEKDSTWLNQIKGWFKNFTSKRTKDGWLCISESKSQLDNYTCQAVYMRLSDTPIGPAMQNIDAWEKQASYLSDKVKSMAYSKLFMKSTKIKNYPALSSGEEVVGVENADVEALKASDMKYLVPPDISNIATISLQTIEKAIMASTMSIDLQPEILKSGADSSMTLKILLRRELQWCHIAWTELRPAAQKLIDVLKGLVGKIEEDTERYVKLRVSVWNTPYLPMDESSEADRVTKLLYAGVLSQEAARQELNLQYSNDGEKISKEAEDKLYRETYTKIKAEAEARKKFGLDNTANDVVVDKTDNPDNPVADANKPKIDNNADRRDIAS